MTTEELREALMMSPKNGFARISAGEAFSCARVCWGVRAQARYHRGNFSSKEKS